MMTLLSCRRFPSYFLPVAGFLKCGLGCVNDRGFLGLLKRISIGGVAVGIEHVLYRLALEYPGGMRQLAEDAGRNYNVFINKLNPNVSTHHAYIEEIDLLVAFLDTDEVAKYFAAQRSLICVKSPGFAGISDNALLDLFFDLESEKAQWLDGMRSALSDGNVSADEFAAIEREYSEFISVSAEMMERIRLYMQASEERCRRLNGMAK